MTACGMKECPFNYEGTCRDRFTIIDNMGMCKQIWWRGQRRPDALDPVDEEFMREINVTIVAPDQYTVVKPEPELYHQITFEEYLSELNP